MNNRCFAAILGATLLSIQSQPARAVVFAIPPQPDIFPPASLYHVSVQGIIDTFNGPVYGYSTPTEFSGSFIIDTSIASLAYYPAGSVGPTPYLNTVWPDGVYGIDANAITSLSMSFGSHTWNAMNISTTSYVDGVEAGAWFDGPLFYGTSPAMVMQLNDPSSNFVASIGFLLTIPGYPPAPSEFLIGSNIAIFDHGTSPSTALSHDLSVSVSAIPLPAALCLFGSALLGLAGIGRRRSLS